MKKITIVTVLFLIFNCFCLTSCNVIDPLEKEELESEDKKIESEDEELESEDEELRRAKLALSNELKIISRICDDQFVTYHSHTYFTVEKMSDGGHFFAGKIFFKDRYGSTYYANYDAFVGLDSWCPIITISNIKSIVQWE